MSGPADRPTSRKSPRSATRLTSHRPQRPAAGAQAKPGFNDAESPLTWLRSRRGPSGEPLLSDTQYLAGERLRADFERAMLMRRVTVNWDTAGTGSRGGNAAADLSDGAIAARQRYHRALDAVGPELSGILSRICCMAEGLEQAERELGLPQRSGKAVLGLALNALARHYGLLQAPQNGARGTTSWSAEGARPVIRGNQLEDA